MSVINKMLRDLDQRQMAGGQDSNLSRAPLAVPSAGAYAAAPAGAASAWRVGAGVAVVAILGLAGWLGWQRLGADRASAMAPATTSASAPLPAVKVGAVSGIVTATVETTAVPTFPAPTASVPGVDGVPLGGVLATDARGALPVVPVVPPPVAVAAAAAASPARLGDGAAPSANPVVNLRMESTLSARKALNAVLSGTSASASASLVPPPVAAPVGSAKTNPTQTEPPSAAQRQQQASADALAQAQTLWSAGSHAAATDLLQQAVDAAERSAKAGTSAVANPAFLSLVRELVRLHMAQSHFAAVWELLVRLEPVLGNQADLWALRGNTGQRLGRHQDSVNAYRTAL